MNQRKKTDAPNQPPQEESVLLTHGAGGVETSGLIKEIFLKYLGNPLLNQGEDGALLQLAPQSIMTTDSFTVSPLFFPGGDIGKLAIAGLCNDLAVMGATPQYLSLTFIIEEGFPFKKLHKLLSSMQKELLINKAQVVAADTKVIENRGEPQILISGSAVGRLESRECSIYQVSQNDEIVVSGPVGSHGAVIMMERSEFSMQSDLQSDCRSLWPVINKLLERDSPRAMRDITRGGLATILNEWASQSKLSIEIDEDQIPVQNEVRGFCELLGLDELHLACEGQFVAAMPRGKGEAAASLLQKNGFKQAALIGNFTQNASGSQHGHMPEVILNTGISRRRLEPLRGEMLPRIC